MVADARCLTQRIHELQRILAPLVAQYAPRLVTLPGCGIISAARLIAETQGITTFLTDAQYAMTAGVAPLDASSGKQQRHRLNRGGNRKLNLALHTIAITQARTYRPARDYIARRQAEGKSRREAIRCLKRYLARAVHRILTTTTGPATTSTAPKTPCLT